MLVSINLADAVSAFKSDDTYRKDFYFGVKNTDGYYTTKERVGDKMINLVRVDRGQCSLSKFYELAAKSLFGAGIFVRTVE